MGILQLFSVFNKPYPNNTDAAKQTWSVVIVSLFVFFFLLVFKPFGLHQLSTLQRLKICLGYGACTAIAMTLNYIATNWAAIRYQLEEKWTVGKHILWNGWLLLTIALINLLYSNLIGISNFTATNLFISLGQVFVIGLFPVTAIVLIDFARLYRKNMHKAQELREQLKQEVSTSSDFFILQSSNNSDRLQLKPNELLYITSADNYVKVVFCIDSKIKQKLLRGTLKDFARHISHPKIIRCHRSFIVNLLQVADISGNARGYTLSIRHTNVQIPVSKTYLDHVNQQLTKTDF